MERLRTAALAGACAALLCSCVLLPTNTSPVDTHMLYAWPLDRCPSEPPAPGSQRAAPIFGSLATILAGDLISALVGIPASALADAADADKKGFTASGTNARFYYRMTRDDQGALKVSPPGCYVIAYAKPEPSGSWCADAAFAKGAAKACRNGRALLDSLYSKDRLAKQVEPRRKTPSVPEFYAEIGFDPSGYETVVRPRVAALYYPKSLLDPSSSDQRTLSLSLTLSAPVNGDALKAASVAITLPGIKPGAVDDEALANAQTAWSSLPVIKPGENLSKEGSYLPITIAATVHEVGEPNVFLAAFAKSLSASTGDISKAIGNAVLPAGQAAADQQAQTNVANYNSAYAAALKSNADYLAACAKGPSSAADKQAAEALYYSVVAARQKAAVAAASANLPPPPFGADPSPCF